MITLETSASKIAVFPDTGKTTDDHSFFVPSDSRASRRRHNQVLGAGKYLKRKVCGSRTCKPNSVCRVAPAGRPFLWAGHCCPALATYPEVVARRASTRTALQRLSFPIWSCSVWGLPCPRHYCRGGALLPHLFTLTPALRPGRYVFCGTFRQPGLNPASRMLSGTLLCGVRTFLPCSAPKGGRSGRPVRLPTS